MVLAEALAANRDLRGQAFNFSNEIQVTVLELVERLLGLMNSKLEPDVRSEATNEIRHQYLSAAKARRTGSAGNRCLLWMKGCAARLIGTKPSSELKA